MEKQLKPLYYHFKTPLVHSWVFKSDNTLVLVISPSQNLLATPLPYFFRNDVTRQQPINARCTDTQTDLMILDIELYIKGIKIFMPVVHVSVCLPLSVNKMYKIFSSQY